MSSSANDHHILLRVGLLGLMLLVSCKSISTTDQSPESSAEFKAIANDTYEVSLTPHEKDNSTVYAITTCHKTHNTCINSFRTSPTPNHPHGSEVFFNMSRFDSAQDLTSRREAVHTAEITELTNERHLLDTNLEKFQNDLKVQILATVQESYNIDNLDKIPMQELEKHLEVQAYQQAKGISNALAKASHPDNKKLAYLAVFGTQLPSILREFGHSIYTNPTLKQRIRDLPLNTTIASMYVVSIVVLVEGGWWLLNALSSHSQKILTNTSQTARQNLLESGNSQERVEQIYQDQFAETIAKRTEEVANEQAKIDRQIAKLNTAYAADQAQYSLLFKYLHDIPQPTVKNIEDSDPPDTIPALLNQLGHLLDRVVRTSLQSEQNTQLLTQFADKPIVAQFCLPGSRSDQKNQAGQYEVEFSCTSIQKQPL